MFFAHMYVNIPCAFLLPIRSEKVSSPLNLELQMVVNHIVMLRIKSGPLQEQHVPLIIEPFLHPHIRLLLYSQSYIFLIWKRLNIFASCHIKHTSSNVGCRILKNI